MKRVLLTAAIVVMTSAAAAQPDEGLTEVSFGAGIGMPVGEFNDIYMTGLLVGSSIGYFVDDQFEIGAEFGYHRYAADEDVFDPGIAGVEVNVDVHAEISQFSATGRYLLTPEFNSAYLKGSIGLYHGEASGTISASGAGQTASENVDSGPETDLGFGVGAGYQYKGKSNLGFYVEGIFTHISTADEATQMFSLRGGLTFYLGRQ
jgi:hypothetical protein